MINRVLVLVMASLLSAVAKAQLHSSFYDEDQKKCILVNTRSNNTLESVCVIGDDMTTFEFDPEERLIEAVNSIATLEINYDGDEAKAECTIDGDKKLHYHVAAKDIDSISMAEFRRQNEFINGSKSWDNFFTGGYAKLVFDVVDNTINLCSKSVQNCYLEAIKFVGRLRNGVNDKNEDKMDNIKTATDAFMDYVDGGVSKATPGLAMKTLGYVIEKYPEWKDNFAENLYKFMNEHRKAQKRKNESKQAWKKGVLDMVNNGQFTLEEGNKLIRKVEHGEISIRELYGGFKYGIVKERARLSDIDGDESNQNTPASDPNIALNAVKQYLTGGKGFGKLIVVEVEYRRRYQYFSTSVGDWKKKYNPDKNGKLVLSVKDNWEFECPHCPPDEDDHPYYYIRIAYLYVSYYAYVDPVGNIFHLEMCDSRGGGVTKNTYLIGQKGNKFILYNWAP